MLLFQIWLWGAILLSILVMGYFVRLHNSEDLSIARENKAAFIVIGGLIILWPLVVSAFFLLLLLLFVAAFVDVKTN